MKKIKTFAIVSTIALLAPVCAVAQTPASQVPVTVPTSAAATPPVAVLVPGQVTSTLHVGTPVVLKLTEGLSTKHKTLRVNDRVHMEVAEAVLVNGVVIIPVGSPALGEITEVRNKGMWGKSGMFMGRALKVDVNGRSIRLSGNFDSKGSAGGGAAIAVSAIVFLPAGFFMTGTSAELPAGTTIRGFIDEEVPLAITPASMTPATQPMVIKN